MISQKGVAMSFRCFYTVFSVVLLLGFVRAVSANEYSFGYSVEAGYEYIENVRLTPENELDISGGRLAIPAVIASKSERLDASLTGELEFSRFDEDAWDSDDQRFIGRASYLLEKGDVNGYAGYKRDSTRTGEFLDTGVTGLEATRREVVTAGGSVNQLFTERNGLTAGLDYRGIDYETLLLRDYDFVSGYLGWLHQWSERAQLRVQGYASAFENDDNFDTDLKVETDTLGAQVGFDTTLSEKMSMSLLLGWANLESEYSSQSAVIPEDDEADEILLKATLDYRSERHELSLEAGSEPTGSGNGLIVSGQYVGVDYSYALSERSSFDLELDAGQRSAIDDRIENDRDFARLELGLDYQFSQSWHLVGSYAYVWQDRERAIDSADSNQVTLSVIYKPTKHVWSR